MFWNKKVLLAIFLVISTFQASAINNTDFLNDPEHQFWFDINDVPTVELVFDEAQWQLLLTSTRSDREEVSAMLIYFKSSQRYQLDNIGVKVSGNTSFILPESPDDPYVQANFTLDFDEFVDEQTLSGISKVKLKRFHNDSTYVHEPLSNQIMHNFDVWTVHSSTYVKLNITVGDRDSAYYGMYRLNESVNRHEYLDKRFGTDNDGGFLWQGNYKDWGPAHFSRIDENWGGVGDFDQASFEYKGKGKKYEEAHTQLVDFAQNVTQLEGSEFEAYVDQHINMELFLKGLASESILGHWDGFWGNGNNYFVYFDESQMMHFVPYDTDNALGTSLIVSDSGEQNPINFASNENAPLLVKKVLAIDKYLLAYKGYIETLVTQSNLMVEDYAVDWIEQIHTLISSDVVNDTGDNLVIADEPAYWGNQDRYRIFDVADGKNWYETRLNAVNKALGNEFSLFENVYYRGVTNNWQASLMTETLTNIWSITVNNDAATNASGEPRFKFDIFADWSENYGDDDGDGKLEQGGDNILFTEGFGEYLITFNGVEKSYLVEKTTDVVEALHEPVANAGTDIELFVGETVHLDARNSTDSDGEIISYDWSNGLTGASVFFVYSQSGTYDVILTVTDNDNLIATDMITIIVKDKAEETPESPIIETPNSENRSGGSVFWLFPFVFIVFFVKTFKLNAKKPL